MASDLDISRNERGDLWQQGHEFVFTLRSERRNTDSADRRSCFQTRTAFDLQETLRLRVREVGEQDDSGDDNTDLAILPFCRKSTL